MYSFWLIVVVPSSRSRVTFMLSLHTGVNVPPQSIPGTCDHPSTTSRPLYTPSALILYTHRVPTTFRTFGTEVMGTSSYTPCFSRLAISLSQATFQRAACGRVIASSKVFDICSLFSPPEKLPSTLVATYTYSTLKVALSAWCATSSV